MSDGEGLELAGGWAGADLKVADVIAHHLLQFRLKLIKVAFHTLSHQFDAAVGEVSYEALDGMRGGNVPCGLPEADTLDVS